jgi:hypothetical protein
MPSVIFQSAPRLEWGTPPIQKTLGLMDRAAASIAGGIAKGRQDEADRKREDLWRSAELDLKRQALAERGGGAQAKDRAELARKILQDEGFAPGSYDPETVEAARQTLRNALGAEAAAEPGGPSMGPGGLLTIPKVDPMAGLRATLGVGGQAKAPSLWGQPTAAPTAMTPPPAMPTMPAAGGAPPAGPTAPTMPEPMTGPGAAAAATGMPAKASPLWGGQVPIEAMLTDDDIRQLNRARTLPPEMELPDWVLNRPLFSRTDPEKSPLYYTKRDVGREVAPIQTIGEALGQQRQADLPPIERVRAELKSSDYGQKYGGGVDVSDEELVDLTSGDPERAKARLLGMIQRAKADPGYAVNLRGLVNALRNAGITIPGSQGEYQRITGR